MIRMQVRRKRTCAGQKEPSIAYVMLIHSDLRVNRYQLALVWVGLFLLSSCTYLSARAPGWFFPTRPTHKPKKKNKPVRWVSKHKKSQEAKNKLFETEKHSNQIRLAQSWPKKMQSHFIYYFYNISKQSLVLIIELFDKTPLLLHKSDNNANQIEKFGLFGHSKKLFVCLINLCLSQKSSRWGARA